MSLISGSVIFSDSTYNASVANEILGTGVFQDNSYNLGIINDAKFLGNSQNNNIVLNTATFYDGAVNNSSVANAVFYGNSSNLGVIVESGVFYGTSCNSGVVSGNAIFADTSSNLGSVKGDASFADTVTSLGEVLGSSGSYVNPINHQYSYTGSNSGVYWSNDQPLAVGSVLYTDQHHNQTLTFTNFQLEGSTYYVNVAGVVNYIMAPAGPATHWYDDSSDAAHAVTLNGSVTQSDEGGGVKAALFDGSSNLVYADSSDFNFGDGDYTVSMFVKPGTQSQGTVSYVSTADPIDNEGFFLGESGHALETLESNGSSWLSGVIGSGIVAQNVWNHIEYVRSSGTVYAFVNGVLSHTYASTVTLTNLNNLIAVGGRSVANQYFVGKIANLQVIKGTALHTSDFSVPTTLPTAVSGTQLLLNFGATAVPTVTPASNWYDDASDAAHAVTLNGSVTQSDEGGGVKAALFDGNASNYLSFDSSDFGFGSTPFTWEAFIKSGDNSTHQGYEFFFGTPSDFSFFYREQDAQYATLTFFARNASNNIVYLNNTTPVDFSAAWHHIAASYDGTTLKLFIDGNLYAQGNFSELNWGSETWVGRGTYGYSGKIAAIRVVKGTALYASNFTVPTAIPTAVSGTQLLLNFGATAVPTVINHQYQHDAYWSDDATLVDGSILYTGQHTNTTANNVTQFTEGDYYINTNGSGVVSLSFVNDLWYNDTSSSHHSVTLNGTAAQSDEGSGVVAALLSSTTLTYSSVNVGTGKDDSTVEFFIKFTDLTSAATALRVIDGLQTGEYTLVYGPNVYASSVSYPVFRLTSYYQGLNVDGFRIYENVWNHVAIVRYNHVFKMYINGTHYPFVTQNGGGDFTGETWDLASSTNIRLGDSGSNQNVKFAGLRAIKGTALYTTDFTAPTSLPTAVSDTQLLLNFGATAAPTVTTTWFSWNGYPNTGDSTTNCSSPYNHQSLFSLVSTLTIGTQMYTDGSNDNSPQPNAAVSHAGGPGSVVIDGHIYHWGSDGKIDSITSCGGY